ncbi:MAG: DUF3090 family protein [Anaerolineales bacterium]|nr:DUF3090 family protein [Anaerolineales bacterium]
MSGRIQIDLNPVDYIRIDAIGQPGERAFYIQGGSETMEITILVEKFQIETLAIAIQQFLDELTKQYNDLFPVPFTFQEKDMIITPPVEPFFRAGEIGLGYNAENDLVIIVVEDILMGEMEEADAREVRYWGTREQMGALALWGLEVVSRGRSIDTTGYFDPRKNGNKNH